MYKTTVTYQNFFGEEVTRDLFFHISKLEMLSPEFEELPKVLEKLQDTQDPRMALGLAKRIALMAYGKRSEDGDSFIKNDELREAFENSPAFEEFVIGLFEGDESPQNLIDFVNHVTAVNIGVTQENLEAKARELGLEFSNDGTPANTEILPDLPDDRIGE